MQNHHGTPIHQTIPHQPPHNQHHLTRPQYTPPHRLHPQQHHQRYRCPPLISTRFPLPHKNHPQSRQNNQTHPTISTIIKSLSHPRITPTHPNQLHKQTIILPINNRIIIPPIHPPFLLHYPNLHPKKLNKIRPTLILPPSAPQNKTNGKLPRLIKPIIYLRTPTPRQTKITTISITSTTQQPYQYTQLYPTIHIFSNHLRRIIPPHSTHRINTQKPLNTTTITINTITKTLTTINHLRSNL